MSKVQELERILVLDFGAQYAHLICRRIRELGVFAQLVPHNITPEKIESRKARGLILSGGPSSVLSANAPMPNGEIYKLGIPILGICYGLQTIVHQLGGKVVKSTKKEYGKATIVMRKEDRLFNGLGPDTICWMSHGDAAQELPPGFRPIASSANSPYAAIASGNLYAVQFHPEVTHTPEGKTMLSNFVFDICGCSRNWSPDTMVEDSINILKDKIGPSDRVICALSGGVDSSTTAALIEKVIGERLTCVFVDHGLLRKGEREKIESTFRPKLGSNLIVVDDSKNFLRKLRNVRDPERKRKIMGMEFIRTFTQVSKRLGNVSWLAQGTLYTDVVESAAAFGRNQSRIKSHHNVGGLPKRIGFKLIEPLKDLYKDEVRLVARKLGLPNEIVSSHPFPGPGLAVRIVGEINADKIRICRDASAIVEDELRSAGLYDQVWQSYALVGDDKATGVLGDERSLGHIVTIRIIQSIDGMTADWYRAPYEVLEKMSNRITNEVPGVTWVSYAISSKPPSTIEPQ